MTLSASDVSDEFLARVINLTGAPSEKDCLNILRFWRLSPGNLSEGKIAEILDLLVSIMEIEVVRTGYGDGDG
jgi:hypothetical protein